MSATIIDLAAIRARKTVDLQRQDEDALRSEASGFAETLQAAVERFNLNLPVLATLLMAKAVDAICENEPHTATEDSEWLASSRLLQAIVKARASARGKAGEDAVRMVYTPK